MVMTATDTTEKTREENNPDANFDQTFNGHVAERSRYVGSLGKSIHEITWKRPGPGCYSIVYRAINRVLLVTGDVDSAMHQVPSPAGLDFWATCDIHYFAKNCVASPSGRGFRVWSPEAAKAHLLQLRETNRYLAFSLLIIDSAMKLSRRTTNGFNGSSVMDLKPSVLIGGNTETSECRSTLRPSPS
jgi:hypothetical protein